MRQSKKLPTIVKRCQLLVVTLCVNLKVDLHRIHFSSVFVRFFTFLLLLEKVCAFSSAYLYVHIRTNQTGTYWTKVFRKKFFVKRYRYSFILKYSPHRSYTKFYQYTNNSLLSADMDL